ncbi:YciI family protein [Geodermatophilus sp. TF02-6]|uniref:YciI family protein n=1 Tax=Geodermatophilus sp. TF02-6 TaxID=2250575 RepID=UPI001F1798DB|nr:YciI family protein [Geodermatophilus sp. TF02-6]
MPAVKYVMTYRAVEDFLPLARQHGPAHAARLHEFHDRGVLLMVGTFDEPANGEALGVFTTRESAEEFVAGDPFVVHGVVAEWSVRPWNEVLQP